MENLIGNKLSTAINFIKAKKTDKSLMAIDNRIRILKNIKNWILSNLKDITKALKIDLNKHETEALIAEVRIILKHISYYLKNMNKFFKDHKVKESGILNLYAKGYYAYKPKGIVFLISPYNYPFHLTLLPLITSLASGNYTLVKTSSKTPKTSQVIYKMIQELNLENYICFLNDILDKAAIFDIIANKIDLLCFTGGFEFGSELKKQADLNNVEVLLELGSPNPVIVDETADIKLAAKRIVWAKLFNMGQTCVAPNSIYCDEKVYNKLIDAINSEFAIQYDLEAFDYVKMINQQHLQSVVDLVLNHTSKQLEFDISTLTIKPKLIKVQNNNPLLFEEIFAPVLFITSFKNINEFCSEFKDKINYPLAFYLFSNNEYNIKNIKDNFLYGSLNINEMLLNANFVKLPFGGIKKSGLGKYHGNFGLATFSNLVAIVIGNKKDLKFRYFHKIEKFKTIIKYFVKH